jgi:hypothetical protein
MHIPGTQWLLKISYRQPFALASDGERPQVKSFASEVRLWNWLFPGCQIYLSGDEEDWAIKRRRIPQIKEVAMKTRTPKQWGEVGVEFLRQYINWLEAQDPVSCSRADFESESLSNSSRNGSDSWPGNILGSCGAGAARILVVRAIWYYEFREASNDLCFVFLAFSWQEEGMVMRR